VYAPIWTTQSIVRITGSIVRQRDRYSAVGRNPVSRYEKNPYRYPLRERHNDRPFVSSRFVELKRIYPVELKRIYPATELIFSLQC
jgi:hypothetical protein